MRIRGRGTWTTTSPGGSPLGQVGELFIHHTAGPEPEGGAKASRGAEEALIRATRSYHVNSRGYSDIAYNYGVMPSGRAYTLRGPRAGGHTFGWNSSSLAIVGFGNYDAKEPTDDLVEAMSFVRTRLIDRGFLTKNPRTRGHRDVGGQYGGTACPGIRLYNRLDEIKRRWRRPHHGHHPHRHPHRKSNHHHHRHSRKTVPHRSHPASSKHEGHSGHHHRHRHKRGGEVH